MFLVGSVLLIFLVFCVVLCFILFIFFCICPVSYVPNVTRVSGLSSLDCYLSVFSNTFHWCKKSAIRMDYDHDYDKL